MMLTQGDKVTLDDLPGEFTYQDELTHDGKRIAILKDYLGETTYSPMRFIQVFSSWHPLPSPEGRKLLFRTVSGKIFSGIHRDDIITIDCECEEEIIEWTEIPD